MESATDLLKVYPGATISFTYLNKKSKKHPEPDAQVKVKVTDHSSGRTVKYSTSKAKDGSRLLAFLGPRGMNLKRKNTEEQTVLKKTKLDIGAAALMSNFEYEEEQPEQKTEKESTPAEEQKPQAGGSKKKKKKSKRK